MALPTHQCLLAIVFAVLAIPAGADHTSTDFSGGYQLGDCSPDPRWRSSTKGAAFRASLAPLLAALPSAAALTGFASLRSADGRALARGFCYGESPSPHDCRKCLARSRAWLDICSGSRRAGFWNTRCFLAYGDTNASFASEDEQTLWRFDDGGDVGNYYPEFYDVQQLVHLAQSLARRAAHGSRSGGRMVATANVTAQANSTVRVLAQCPENVTAADCQRCLEKSAQEYLPECLRVPGHEHDGVQSAGVANVFRYKCYLRLEISAPLPMGRGARLRKKMKDHLAVVLVVAVAIVVAIVGAAFLVLRRIRTSKAQAARHVDG